MHNSVFDTIIVGGSYAGLAAGMALGRALKTVLIIDNGRPCNRQTPYSHNFLTNDGKPPAEINALARLQVEQYDTIQFLESLVTDGFKTGDGFGVTTSGVGTFEAKTLIFATGIKDIYPFIKGFADCWGISVLHCPYCHGYEVRNRQTGIIANGEVAFDFVRLISNWTKKLTLFTNGKSTLTSDQKRKLWQHSVQIIEKKIVQLEQHAGLVKNIVFDDDFHFGVEVIYAPIPFEQHCKIPQALGCEMTDEGYIKTDGAYETTVKGIYAIGDSSSRMRTVANAVSMGTAAGIVVSKKMVLEAY